MKLCPSCREQHEAMLKKLLGVEITECRIEECEFGHPRYRPELPKELAEKTKKLKKRRTESSNSTWGLVYIDAPPIPVAWYWWIDCETRKPVTLCRPWRPSDTENCDIHYEPWIWIEDLQGWFGGLVNFGGCEPATNCGGNCGQVNSKRNGVCLQKYSDAPEVFQDGWLCCLYAKTPVRDCLLRTQYMILDYDTTGESC